MTAGSHVLIFPFPAQGHMLSLLDLTHQLALRGTFITVIITPKNLSSLTSVLSAHPTTVTTLLLPLPPHPSIPAGVENVKDLPHGSMDMMVALGDLYIPVLNWFRNHPNPPVAIVSDMFLGWTHRLAGELGIRRYTFSPSGVLALSAIFSLWRYQPKRVDPQNENEMIKFTNMPNSPKYPWWQLSPVYRGYVEGDPNSEFIKDGLRGNMGSWGIVINSYTELERVYVEHIKDELGHERVFLVGPLLPPANTITERGGPGNNVALPWLDTCTNESVVYICFGSQVVLSNNQMHAVALGLEKSRVKFVWSVKEPTTGHVAGKYGKIPEGFEDRVAGRGLVVRGWVPQVAILSHDSVGAFLTHCGWNSVLEEVVAEVLMLTWPMTADQHSNATLLHELKIGIKACEGRETVPDSNELARLFSKSMNEDTRAERENVKEFGRAGKKAIEKNGSSWKELGRLVADFSN